MGRYVERDRASLLEAEAAHELVSDLALPVDVRTGGDSGEPDRRDDLPPRDLLADAYVHGARVVVADGQVAGVLDANAQTADRDPACRRHDAVVARAEPGAVWGRDVDAGVTPPEVLRDHAADRPREAAVPGLLRDLRRRREDVPSWAVGLEKRRQFRAAHEDLLTGRALLRLERAAVVGEDDRWVDLELARDRLDRVPVLDGVERALGRRDHQLLPHPQRARVAQAVGVGNRLDRDVVVVRHRGKRVAVVDRDLLHRSRAFSGDRQRIAAGRDRTTACSRLCARGVARGCRGADRWRNDRTRPRRGRRCERQRENEHRDGGVEGETQAANAYKTREVAAASVEGYE